jgi:D-glycero-D-manno-heptose 1,7-bisphosphate phosphatase
MAVIDRTRAVFLDKDGTLIDDVPFNIDPGRMRLAAGAGQGLRLLSRAGYRLLVVSNQPGVAMGFFPEHALMAVRHRLEELVHDAGASLSGFYYCPHLPGGKVARYRMPCLCRKPAPGMLRHAAREHGLDLRRAWMVGDILDDIEAGRAARCRTVLIDNGNETEWDLAPRRRPHRIVSDLTEAAEHILGADRQALESLQGAQA